MIPIYRTITNNVVYCRWPDDYDYYWVLLNGELFAGPIEVNNISFDALSTYKTIQVIGDDSQTYDWTDSVLDKEIVKNCIKVKFNPVSGAVAYRVTVDGSVDSGFISEDGSDYYEYISSPVTVEGQYTVDVQYQDAAGNWSSIEHPYKIDMYIVPAGTYFTVAASSGTITFSEV